MTMRYVEAFEEWDGKYLGLFIAGGITGCPNWQQVLCSLLADRSFPGVVINPRRDNFPIHDPNAAREQITWEFRHLKAAHMISFWFAAETIQPIVLYELGAWARYPKPIFVGVHPKYPRRQDVEIQLELARPGTPIATSLERLANQVANDAKGRLNE